MKPQWRPDSRRLAAWIGLLAALAAGLLAAQPLLSGRLPRGDDALLHLYRAAQLDRLVENGIGFSRWAPDLAYGYGVPLFNFYAPLLYYLVELGHVIGLGLAPALLLALAGSLMLSAAGMWLWAGDLFGRRAGLVAAAAWVCAPYTLYNLLHRGAYAEHLALSLAPLLFWLAHRAVARGQLRYAAGLAAGTAALLLSHNITALILAPLLAGYAALASRLARRSAEEDEPAQPQPRWPALARAWLPIAAGLGLTAFFWLPALAERDLVQIEKTYLPAVFDYRNHFIALSEVLSLPQPVESGLVDSSVPRSLSLPALALATVGIAAAAAARRPGRASNRMVVAAAAALALSAGMALAPSQPGWDAIPVLRFVQFPWRWLGLASLFTALLAGAGFAAIDRRLARRPAWAAVALAAALGVLALVGFAWQFAEYHPRDLGTSMADVSAYERAWSAPGLSAGEYLPKAVLALPSTDATSHFDPATLPPDAELAAGGCGLLSCDLALRSGEPFTLSFNVFDFPGWSVQVDGAPAASAASAPHGLLSVAIPAGEHRVTASFGSTPVRDAGTAISILTLAAGLVVFGALAARRANRAGRAADGEPSLALHSADEGYAGLLAALAVLALAFALKALVLDARDTPLRQSRFDGQAVRGADIAADVRFGGQLALIGLDLHAPGGAPGTYGITLYWRALGPVDRDYHVSVQLTDRTGYMVSQANHEHPGGAATSLWPEGAYARDAYAVPLAAGTPPGEYRIHVVVYEAGQPANRLPATAADGAAAGAAAGDAPAVATAQVGRAHLPEPTTVITPDVAIDQPLGLGLRLMGSDELPAALRPGDAFRLALWWRADNPPQLDARARIRLAGATGTVLEEEFDPVAGLPATQWRAGDVWHAPHVLRLPPSLPGGRYRLAVSLAGGQGEAVMGEMDVAAPPHEMARPAIAHPQEAQFGQVARLLGYDVPARVKAGQPLTVTLVWQAAGETPAGYKVFAHLVDARGDRVAGDDAVPAAGERPTRGWVAGEHLIDIHVLSLPADLAPGEYRVRVGLYDEASLQRLGLVDGGDAVELERAIAVER
jgi:hypothetical protein